jgi:hypothetical protein
MSKLHWAYQLVDSVTGVTVRLGYIYRKIILTAHHPAVFAWPLL